MDPARDELRTWLRRVLAERGWTAEQWARHADLAPTTLTRFLNKEGHWILSFKTVRKLADAAGVALPGSFDDDGVTKPHLKRVPLLKPSKTAVFNRRTLRDMADKAREFIAADIDPHQEVYAVEVSVPSYMGVQVGDMILFEPFDAKQCAPGDLILAKTARGIGPFGYHPPLLVPQSSDRQIEPIRINEAQIVGRALQLVRRLVRSVLQAVCATASVGSGLLVYRMFLDMPLMI